MLALVAHWVQTNSFWVQMRKCVQFLTESQSFYSVQARLNFCGAFSYLRGRPGAGDDAWDLQTGAEALNVLSVDWRSWSPPTIIWAGQPLLFLTDPEYHGDLSTQDLSEDQEKKHALIAQISTTLLKQKDWHSYKHPTQSLILKKNNFEFIGPRQPQL